MTDVEVTLENPADVNQVKEMAHVLSPELDWARVAKVRVGNVGVKANQQDSGGLMIFEIQDRAGQVLEKLVQLGWLPGKCAK